MSRLQHKLFIALLILIVPAQAERARAEPPLFAPLERGQSLFQTRLPIVRDLAALKSTRGLNEDDVRRLMRSAPPELFGDWIEDQIVNEPSDERRAALVEELLFAGRELPLNVALRAFEQASFISAAILARLLREAGTREAIEALVQGLDRVQTRYGAEAALIELGERALPALMSHADSSTERDQSALRVIGRIGGLRAKSYLKMKLEHADYNIGMGARQGLVFIEGLEASIAEGELPGILSVLPTPARLDLLLGQDSLPIASIDRYFTQRMLLDDRRVHERLVSGDARLIDLLLRAHLSGEQSGEVLSLLARSRVGGRTLLAFPESDRRDAALFYAYLHETERAGRAEIARALKASRGDALLGLLEGGDRGDLFGHESPALRALGVELAFAYEDQAALLLQLEREDIPSVAALILTRLRSLGALPSKPLLHRLKAQEASHAEALAALALHGAEGLTEREQLARALRVGLRRALDAQKSTQKNTQESAEDTAALESARLYALGLGILGDLGAIPMLRRALRAEAPRVRVAALVALQALDARAARSSARALRAIERDPSALEAIEGALSAPFSSAAASSALMRTFRHDASHDPSHDPSQDPFHDPRRFMLVSEAIRSFPIDQGALPAARSVRE